MKHVKHILQASIVVALICAAGCVSSNRVVVLKPIGPAPEGLAPPSSNGYLQISSAWRKEIDPDALTRGESGLQSNEPEEPPPYTDYTVYGKGGRFLMHVTKEQKPNDRSPVFISLPPGRYEIEAIAATFAGTAAVRVPVVIRSGQTTAGHLDGGWRPHHHYTDDEIVRLPNGNIVGWLAQPEQVGNVR